MKKYLLFIFLSLVVFGCYSQSNKHNKKIKMTDLAFINNKKIKYSIVLMSCDTCVPIKNLGYRVKMQLSKEEKIRVRSITSDAWKALLNNCNSDWASNLILYSLYDKDAFLLSKNNDRELWVKYLKKEDFDFWNNKFNK
jgi:hypothetical protein